MGNDIFHDPTKRLPDSDPRIDKIDFDKSDIGARKSHLPKPSDVVNDKRIDHVK